MLALLTFLALGALVGVLAGLLGIGGGLVLVASLAWLLPQYGIPKEAAMHAALASSLGSIVLTSLSSTRAHHRRGGVLWPSVAWLVPGVMVGAWLGSRFAIGLDGAVLRWAFVGYCLLIAAQMAFSRGPAFGESAPAPRGPRMTLAGGGIGAVSAVVGIGGGSLTVPLLTLLGVAPVRAVGTAAACGIFIGLASAAGYALQAPAGALGDYAIGYVYLPAALGVAMASILTASLGARIAHAISGAALKRVFAVFMLLVGVGMAVW